MTRPYAGVVAGNVGYHSRPPRSSPQLKGNVSPPKVKHKDNTELLRRYDLSQEHYNLLVNPNGRQNAVSGSIPEAEAGVSTANAQDVFSLSTVNQDFFINFIKCLSNFAALSKHFNPIIQPSEDLANNPFVIFNLVEEHTPPFKNSDKHIRI